MIDSMLEAGMMVCWGISWPVQALKTYKTKKAESKSIFFIWLITTGYIFGIIYKALFHYDYVIYLYLLNLIFVVIDMLLYYRYINPNYCRTEGKYESRR